MARGRNNRKRRRTRRRFGPLFKLLCILTAAVALTFGATVFFQVETIVVSGNSRYTQEEIIAAVGVQVGDNLFRMNKFQRIEQAEEQLPYLEDVVIRRSLPSTLTITVKEWEAVAQVPGGEGNWLISVGGKLLEQAPPDSGAITITGLTALAPQPGQQLAVSQEEAPRLEALLKLLAVLQEQNMLQDVSALELTSTRINMEYQGRFTVKLLLNGDFSYRMKVLLEVVPELNESMGGDVRGSWDLTQEEYPAVFSAE